MTNPKMKVDVLTSPHESMLRRYGHLVWWTVHQGIYDPRALQQSGQALDLPDTIKDLLTGTKGKSAWEKATNLRTASMVIAVDPVTRQQTTYTTRDVDSTTRLLVKEVLDQANAKLCSLQVGALTYNNGWQFDPDPVYFANQAEVDTVVKQLESQYYERLDKVDDVKLRTALLAWLKVHFRVPVRGNGGIYFVPRRENEERNAELVREIFAIRDWLNTCALGTITAIEVQASETTTLDDIVASAVNEIVEEISEIETKLKEYKDNERMNAGSRMEATKAQVKRIELLTEKIEALEASLGEQVGMTMARATIIANRAQTMLTRSTAEVDAYRTTKGKK